MTRALAWTTALVAMMLVSGPGIASEPARSLAGAYLAAEHARHQGDLTLSSGYFDRAMDFDRTNPVLAHRAFLMALSTGRFERAVRLAEDIQVVDRSGQISLLVSAVDAMRSGDAVLAASYVDEMEEFGIGRYSVPLMRAWSAVGIGDRDRAEAALAAFDDAPELGALADYHRGLVALAFDDVDTAAEILIFVSEGSVSVRETLVIAAVLRAAGKDDQARDLYTNILALAPDLPRVLDALASLDAGEKPDLPITGGQDGMAEALFHLATLFGGQDSNEIALFYARMAQALAPEAGHILYKIGAILTDMDLPTEAISVLRLADPATAIGWNAHYLATRLYVDQDDLDTAMSLVEELVDQRPAIGGGGILMGDILRYLGDFDGAVTVYEEAALRSDISLDDRWLYVFKVAIALEQIDQFDDAEPLFRHAIDLEPNNATLLNYLGYSLIDRGLKLEEAEQMIREAVALDPQSGHIVDSLGWAHFRLGRFDEAVVELERAAALEPAEAVILDHLGDAYWVVGREREARFRWRDALRLAGDDTDLILAIEQKLVEGLDMDSLPMVPGLEDNTARNSDGS